MKEFRNRDQSDARQFRRTLCAAAAACALLLLAGAGFRSIDAALSATAGGDVPLPSLEQLPLVLGDWTGRDVPLSNQLVRAADVDAHLYRTYASSASGGTVSLFVGYGIRVRDLVPHRPSVCYPGAGWRLASEHPADVPLRDGTTLP